MVTIRTPWIGGYVLLSGLIYLGLEATRQTGAVDILELGVIAGINCVLQGIFIAMLSPWRHQVPSRSWSLALAALYAGALLALLAYNLLDMLQTNNVLSLLATGVMPEELAGLLGIVPAVGLFIWCRGRDNLVALGRISFCVAAGAVAAAALTVSVVAFRASAPPVRVYLPVPLLTLAWCVGPLSAFYYCRTLRKAPKGRCQACGYDLRGLSEMRCPECGRPFTFEEVRAAAEELEFGGAGRWEPGGRRGDEDTVPDGDPRA